MTMPKLVHVPEEEAEDDLYPDSDGKPVGETDYHVAGLVYLREALQHYFRDRPNMYVATDMFLYYEEGNVKARKAPDVMIVRGVPKHFRRSFKLWREAAGPWIIIELISRKTRRDDLQEKPGVYARLGVEEYYVYDPEGKTLRPPLQGFRRRGRRFLPRKLAGDGSLTSRRLGLRLVPERQLLRLIDLRTGEPLLTGAEQAARAEEAEQRAQSAEAELARLRALLENTQDRE
jgi:Uma2 family endonuclease